MAARIETLFHITRTMVQSVVFTQFSCSRLADVGERPLARSESDFACILIGRRLFVAAVVVVPVVAYCIATPRAA